MKMLKPAGPLPIEWSKYGVGVGVDRIAWLEIKLIVKVQISASRGTLMP